MRRTPPALFGILLLAGLGGASASADRKLPLEGQPPIRHKVELRKFRFEATPQFMVSLNQDFRHFLGGGVALQFYFTDWLAVGAQFAGGGGVDTGLTSKIRDTLPDPTDPSKANIVAAAFQPDVNQFQQHLATTVAMFSIYGTLVPFSGKLSLFGAAFLHYDFYGMIGIGGLLLSNNFPKDGNQFSYGSDAYQRNNCGDNPQIIDPNSCNPNNSGLKFGGMFGVGFHMYFNDWVGFNLELRDFLVKANYGGLEVDNDALRKLDGDDERIGNNLFVAFGVTFMLPPTAKISP